MVSAPPEPGESRPDSGRQRGSNQGAVSSIAIERPKQRSVFQFVDQSPLFLDEFRFGLGRAKEQLLGSVNFKQVSGKTKPSWELKKGTEVKVVSHEERHPNRAIHGAGS